MKRSEKQLPSKANFRTLETRLLKGLRVTKNVKEIKFEGIWGNLESKKGFQR